jgi:lysine N6-hydroxylase
MNPPSTNQLYDILGIGIGPFNLGLAALSAPIDSLTTIFFEQSPEFSWHPGMMLKGAKLQVPYLADLVTLVDPCSRFSFVNYLKQIGRLFHFCIKEDIFISRHEYNQYCRWVAAQLPACQFGHRVERVEYDADLGLYAVTVLALATEQAATYHARHVVLGVGSRPALPAFCAGLPPERVLHSADYLRRKASLPAGAAISLIGSGQSAAEVFYDLLTNPAAPGYSLAWFSRADRFYPMEYSKLTLEFTSPDYVDYFYGLPPARRERVLAGQDSFYKGINFELINAIYDELYDRSAQGEELAVHIQPACELTAVAATAQGLELTLHQHQQGRTFQHATDVVILATGYQSTPPAFLEPVRDHICWDEQGRFAVARNYAIDQSGRGIFVQNAELHTHGFVAPDLGMGPYRNAWILNEILGTEHYQLDRRIAFQTFGAPEPTPAAVPAQPLAHAAR